MAPVSQRGSFHGRKSDRSRDIDDEEIAAADDRSHKSTSSGTPGHFSTPGHSYSSHRRHYRVASVSAGSVTPLRSSVNSRSGVRSSLLRGFSDPQQSTSIYDPGGMVDDQFHQSDLFDLCEGDEATPLMPLHLSVEAVVQESRLAIPPGPLSFVESNWFAMLSAVLIVFNMVVVSFSTEDEIVKYELDRMNQACLVFYAFELLVRLGHFRLRFFNHPHEAVWNWLDLLIVTVAWLDEWVVPFVQSMVGDHSWAPFIRSFRMTRFFRFFKLLRVLAKGDFSWTEEMGFQTVVALMITLNAIVMGLETDIESPVWTWVEHGMLLFFTFEISVRIKLRGWKFFTATDERGWNWLDFTIVVSGAMDLWVMKLLRIMCGTSDEDEAEIGHMVMLMRTLRLMRILRLLRLVKAVRPLYVLALGILEAMQSMIWVLVLTIVALYIVAILTTRLIGHGSMVHESSPRLHEAQKLFKSVSDSMFTLFAVMNSQDWHKIEPLLDRIPGMKPLFVIFTIYSSWALLSVMTGVVSDNMLMVREAHEQKDEAAQKERRGRIKKVLSEVFAAADIQGSGQLARDEYFEVLNSSFHVKKIQSAASVPLEDLRSMYDWIDVEGKGVIEFADLLNGFHCLNEPITGKSLLQLDSEVKTRFTQLQVMLQAVEDEVGRLRMRSHVNREEVLNILKEFASG